MHYIGMQVVTGTVTDIVCWDSSEKYEECPTGYWKAIEQCLVNAECIFNLCFQYGTCCRSFITYTASPVK